MPHVFICINGINTLPGDSDGWTDRAVTWLHLHTEACAEKWEYVAGALTRRLRQAERAEAIARMAGYYFSRGWTVSFIAHSNGCDLVARVLELLAPRARHVRSVHLFAPAADEIDFLQALRTRRLGWCFLYGSPNDRALQLAGVSRRLFGWAGLGYGSMGLGLSPEGTKQPHLYAFTEPDYGHSTWFTRGAIFDRTMRRIRDHEASIATTATPTPVA